MALGQSMAKGPGFLDVRKLQVTGGSTYTLSLPKEWVKVNGLGARDAIQVDWRPSGALRISALESKREVRRITLSTKRVPTDAILDHLMGAYLAGTDRISIHHESDESRKIKKIIRDFQRFTRGFEIEGETDTRHTLICLLNASEMPLRSSLNQMFLRLNSIVRDALEVLCGGDIDLISDYEEREREIDSQHFLIERQAGIILDSYKVAESLGMTRRQAVEHANLARCLERMADHAFQLADLATKFGGVLSFDSEDLPINQIPIWQEAIRSLMINMRTKDAREIETARNALKSAQVELKEHEQGLWSGKREARELLLEDHISESVRRMCAYARDFGETLLNMIAHEETITGIHDD